MEAPESSRSLARNGLREIAVRGLKSRGLRMDAVFQRIGPVMDGGVVDQGEEWEIAERLKEKKQWGHHQT